MFSQRKLCSKRLSTLKMQTHAVTLIILITLHLFSLVQSQTSLSLGAAAGRPVTAYLPKNYNSTLSYSLLLLLHGYSSNPNDLANKFGVVAASRGFIYLAPSGTIDGATKAFWNASPCCNFFNSKVNDTLYLMNLIEEVKSKANVDLNKIYILGYSNGAMMAYDLACSNANTFASIVALSGTMFADLSYCYPATTVSILDIHGSSDDIVPYGGSASYAPATAIVENWVRLNNCSATSVATGSIFTADANKPNSATPTAYTCRPGTSVQHWKMEGSTHFPNYTSEAVTRVLDFMQANTKQYYSTIAPVQPVRNVAAANNFATIAMLIIVCLYSMMLY